MDFLSNKKMLRKDAHSGNMKIAGCAWRESLVSDNFFATGNFYWVPVVFHI